MSVVVRNVPRVERRLATAFAEIGVATVHEARIGAQLGCGGLGADFTIV